MVGALPRPLRATDSGLDEAHSQIITQAQADIDRGHYAQAERRLEVMVADAQSRGDEDAAAAAWWLLAACFIAQDRPREAKRAYARVAEHHDRQLANAAELPLKIAERYVSQLETVGAYLVNIGAIDDAETVLYAALSGAQQRLTGTSVETGLVLYQLGRIGQTRGDMVEAEEHYRRSIDAFRGATSRAPGVIDEGNGWSLHRLGEVLAAQYRFAEAEPVLLEAYSALQRRYDLDAPELGYVLVSLARLYAACGRLEQAETFFKRSVLVGAGKADQDQIEIADRMTELAELYWRAEQFDQAEALFERAIDRMSDTVGPGSPLTAAILERMADLNWDLGRLGPAAIYCERALELLDAGEDGARDEVVVAMVLHQLASIRFEQGKMNAARLFALRSLKVFETQLPGSAEQASALNLLGQIARGAGELTEAEQYLTDSIALMVRAAGEADPRVVTSVNNLAQVCLEAGTPTHAEGVLRWALNVAARELGMTHPQVELAVDLLYQVLSADGRPDEAEELLSWARSSMG